MIDAVLSYHTNPATCGVAKFNKMLADRLGVPFESLDKHPFACPLISIKTAEANGWKDIAQWYRHYSLFFHDIPDNPWERQEDVYRRADFVYAANVQIANWLSVTRPYVVQGHCPSTLVGHIDRGAFRVLTFGMVHKIAVQQFTQLKARLDREHPDYTIALSSGIHEGTDFQRAHDESVRQLRTIFGGRLRVLGFLADDALARELHECDAVALFFDPALRANNTTAWAALEAGKPLYTNTDEHSPALDAAAHSWKRLLDVMGVGVSA